MPPQPIARIYPAAGISLTPERAVERPDVCAQIGQCIACWSWVETQVSRLFVLLSKQNTEAAIELYNLFGGASLKENSIKVLARTNLEPPDYKIIEALLKVVQSGQKTRDKICHWVWGVSDQIPDGLVLVDPKVLLLQQARISDLLRTGEPTTAADARMTLDDIYVYRTSDLKRDAQSFIALALLVNRCHGLVLRSGADLAQLRDELLKDSRIVERLSS